MLWSAREWLKHIYLKKIVSIMYRYAKYEQNARINTHVIKQSANGWTDSWMDRHQGNK